MNIFSKVLSIFIFALVIASCATGPTHKEIVSNIPSISGDNGRIYFYRKSVFFGDGLRPPIFLNGEKVGEPIPDGFFFLDRAPGDYEVTTSTEVERKLSFELVEGEEKFVRFSITMGVIVGHVYPELVDKAEALKELEGMHYIGEPLGK